MWNCECQSPQCHNAKPHYTSASHRGRAVPGKRHLWMSIRQPRQRPGSSDFFNGLLDLQLSTATPLLGSPLTMASSSSGSSANRPSPAPSTATTSTLSAEPTLSTPPNNAGVEKTPDDSSKLKTFLSILRKCVDALQQSNYAFSAAPSFPLDLGRASQSSHVQKPSSTTNNNTTNNFLQMLIARQIHRCHRHCLCQVLATCSAA